MAPPVVWAQRPDILLLTVQVVDAKEVDIKFEAETFSFSGTVDDKKVQVVLDLTKEIVPDDSSFLNTGREVQIKIKKKEDGYWDTLTKKKMNNVKVDWAKWKDEDELDGAEDLGDFGGMPGMGGMGGMPGMGGMGGMDMQQLMSQMGGAGGMPDMSGLDGGDEGGDSDDEPPAMEAKPEA